ncbi:MAG: DUF4350 domain-containing protein [Polyangiaceae bacterium]|nr:DUF4350 domain-containing protein [Polyangiaceae bacterium]
MPKAELSGRLGLLIVVLAVVAGLFQVVKSRVQQGDSFPAGSAFRSEPSGLRVLHDALLSQGKKSVRRERVQLSRRADLSRTTLLLAAISPQDFYTTDDRLMGSLTALVQAGLRVVVLLDTDVAERCDSERCGVGEFFSEGSEQEAQAKKEAKHKSKKHSAGLFEEWGISLSGASQAKAQRVVRAAASPEWLANHLPWRGRAFFTPENAAWRVVYEQVNKAVVVERKLGKGELVVVASTYPVSNEAIAQERATSFILWLVGERPNIVFEETHLGLQEPKGIVSMARSYGLEGALYGLLVASLVYVWYAGSPLVRRAPRSVRSESINSPLAGFSSLLMRAVPPKNLLQTCLSTYLASLSQVKRAAFAQSAASNSAPSKPNVLKATIDEYNQVVAHVTAQRSVVHQKAHPL